MSGACVIPLCDLLELRPFRATQRVFARNFDLRRVTMRPMQLIGCVFLLTAISGFSIPASATVSVDGSSLLSGGSGSIVTSAGTWTFSTTTGAGGNLILLNGSSSAADGGSGTELVAGNGGNMYVENNVGNWYQWNSGTWTR